MADKPVRPIQGSVLVELKGKYDHLGNTTHEKFGESKTRGVVKAIASDIVDKAKDFGMKVGDTAYFGKYEDTAPFDIDGKAHALIPLEEIRGVQ